MRLAVLIGVGFSLAFVIHESANPHIAVLGRLPGTTVYQNYTKCFMVTLLHKSVVMHGTVSESNSSVDVVVDFKMPGKVYRTAMSSLATSHMLIAAVTEDVQVRLCDMATGAFAHALSGHRGQCVFICRMSLCSIWELRSQHEEECRHLEEQLRPKNHTRKA